MRLVTALAFTCLSQFASPEEVVVEDADDGGSGVTGASGADDGASGVDDGASGAGAAAPAAVDIPAAGEDINRTTFIQLTLANLSLVNFYAPWCEPCKELEPQWEDAAARLAALDPPIPSGRVDAERVKDVASRFNITRYPGLMVFRGSTPYEVPTAEFSADGLVEHMLHQRKLSVASQPVSTVKEVERMSQSAWKWEGVTKVAIILGLFPAGADAPPAEQGIGAPRPRGAIELSMFGDLSYTLHTQRPGFAFAHSFSPAVHTAYGVGKLGPEWEGGDVSNGTLVVVLADQLRQEARGGSEFVLDATSSGVAELAASVLPRHPAASHARLDLSALLAEHASKISTQGRDQTEHHDGSPLSPSERSSRAAIYDAAMDRAGRRAVKQLVQWVTAACTAAPLVGELNTANTPFSPHPLYQLPLLILFYNQPATTKVWRDSLSAIAASEQPRNESDPVLQVSPGRFATSLLARD